MAMPPAAQRKRPMARGFCATRRSWTASWGAPGRTRRRGGEPERRRRWGTKTADRPERLVATAARSTSPKRAWTDGAGRKHLAATPLGAPARRARPPLPLPTGRGRSTWTNQRRRRRPHPTKGPRRGPALQRAAPPASTLRRVFARSFDHKQKEVVGLRAMRQACASTPVNHRKQYGFHQH